MTPFERFEGTFKRIGHSVLVGLLCEDGWDWKTAEKIAERWDKEWDREVKAQKRYFKDKYGNKK